METNLQAPFAVQGFAGSGLVRAVGEVNLSDVLARPGCRVRITLVNERKVCINPTTHSVCWFDLSGLQALGFAPKGATALELILPGPTKALAAPLYYLGHVTSRYEGGGASGEDRAYLAADVTALAGHPALMAALGAASLHLTDVRACLHLLGHADLARAGHAVALSQWHQAHKFCPRCGAPTEPVPGGARRQCSADQAHRLYPRTDPVVIMLVLSPNGNRVLLGRSKKLPEGMLTCLSGFVDQGESIEEAVAREVLEEAGVVVKNVRIIGSQPWPLGRGGSHELMIGCLAQAEGEELRLDEIEMAECHWLDRSQLRDALSSSTSPDSPYIRWATRGLATAMGNTLSTGHNETIDSGNREVRYFVPPPSAIAHHLIKWWVESEMPTSNM